MSFALRCVERSIWFTVLIAVIIGALILHSTAERITQEVRKDQQSLHEFNMLLRQSQKVSVQNMQEQSDLLANRLGQVDWAPAFSGRRPVVLFDAAGPLLRLVHNEPDRTLAIAGAGPGGCK